jgi:hypothetical protein
MAISTDYLTLGNFSKDEMPGRTIVDHLRDVSNLYSLDVIKLQYNRICISTIGARMSQYVFVDFASVFVSSLLGRNRSLRDHSHEDRKFRPLDRKSKSVGTVVVESVSEVVSFVRAQLVA